MTGIPKDRTFIVAELSANHNGSLQAALKSVYAAKRSGADAIKIQTYTPDTITLNVRSTDFLIDDDQSIWKGKYLYDLYAEAYTPWKWHSTIFELALAEGLLCFSSPFDSSAVDFLEDLNCPIYKIASCEITDIPLIRYVAMTGKPVILSTGIAKREDIELAVSTIREAGNQDITVLICTSAYPASIEDANLSMLGAIADDFDVKVGISDHTPGIVAPVVSVALGACVIEKHFIMDKSVGGPDSSLSLDESEFSAMVDAVRAAEQSLGQISYQLSEAKKLSRKYSRSLYVTRDVSRGEVLSEENVRSVRPGFGLNPKHLSSILGRNFRDDVPMGTPLDWKLID